MTPRRTVVEAARDVIDLDDLDDLAAWTARLVVLCRDCPAPELRPLLEGYLADPVKTHAAPPYDHLRAVALWLVRLVCREGERNEVGAASA